MRRRATFDMSCDEVSVVDIGGNTYGVSGCQRRESYVVMCNGDQSAIHRCSAVVNSHGTASPGS